jgi:hypothetical protein
MFFILSVKAIGVVTRVPQGGLDQVFLGYSPPTRPIGLLKHWNDMRFKRIKIRCPREDLNLQSTP